MFIIKKCKYFLNFLRGQENWFNTMSSNGYKLTDKSELSYTFEKCESDEYEYQIEFTEHLSEVEGKKLEDELISSGYKIIKQEGMITCFFYKLKSLFDECMPFNTIKGYENKFLIIEKRKNGNLKTNINISDVVTHLKITRNTYILYTTLLTLVLTHGFLQVEIKNKFMIFITVIFTMLAVIKVINCTTIMSNFKSYLLNKVK